MNLETQTAPIVAAPPLIFLPFVSGPEVPPIKPHYFLEGFSQWIDTQSSEALFALRALSFRAAETDVRAIYAAKRAALVRGKNDPFGAFLSADSDDTALLGDFFFHHLEVVQYQHTLDRLAFLHEMALEGVEASRFDGDAQEHFAAQFGAYIEQEPEWLGEKWRASGLTCCDLIQALLRGDKASPWYGEAPPQTGADWVREFLSWLEDKGVGRANLREYIPSATREEFAVLQASGGRMSSLYLLSGEGDGLHFLCDDPRTFDGWGALSGYWRRFLDSERGPVFKAWCDAPGTDAPGIDDGIAELAPEPI